MNALVVPSNRPAQLAEFFKAWQGRGGWDQVIVVDDGDDGGAMLKAVGQSDRPTMVRNRVDIEDDLGDAAWIISQGDSACRCYGILEAWRAGAEFILTLDDDVRPHYMHEDIMHCHVGNMTHRSRFQSSVVSLYPRGMPSVEAIKGTPGVRIYRDDVKASMGLWAGVPDLYAEDMLHGHPTDYKPPLGTRLIPDGEFVPVCGMNLCIHRDAAPLCWFPLMGRGQPYSRFDDIWMGLILKAGFDALGWKLSVGEPFVKHERASDPVKCAERERGGRAVNDAMWRWFADLSIDPFVSKLSAYDVAHSIGWHLMDHGPSDYAKKMGKALVTWAELFTKE